jgi:acetyl-CoA carboxylase biotin carboxyl carrier protein
MSLDFAQIKELLEILRNSNIGEFKLELRDFSLNVRTDKYISHKGQSSGTFVTATIPTTQQPQQQPIQQIALPTTNTVAPVVNNTTPVANNTPAAEVQPKAAAVKYTEIKSPMVGTFYRAGGPDKPPFVKVGDVVEKDSVLCVIEAMKLFNNVVAEQSGRIVKVLVENATPVEYDQPIFLIEPA